MGFCMDRHVEPLPRRRHSQLMGMKVTRNSVFMPQQDISSKLGIERPSSPEGEVDPIEIVAETPTSKKGKKGGKKNSQPAGKNEVPLTTRKRNSSFSKSPRK